jgi:hypothetical protein
MAYILASHLPLMLDSGLKHDMAAAPFDDSGVIDSDEASLLTKDLLS